MIEYRMIRALSIIFNKLQVSLIIIFFAIIFFSCDDNHIYEKYKKIPSYIWNYNEPVPFEFYLRDTNSLYNIYLNIRNSGIYPYNNIWIIAQRQDATGQISKKRYEFILANPDGSWMGNGLGDIIDNRFILEERIKLKQAGEYLYSFHQEMRVDNLPGIMDVGLEVEKVK
jgi:gliding motility-associated lipoprotein GldH